MTPEPSAAAQLTRTATPSGTPCRRTSSSRGTLPGASVTRSRTSARRCPRPDEPGDKCEGKALDEQQSNDARAARAQGLTHGDLVSTGCASQQEQVADVETRREQEQSRGAGEQKQWQTGLRRGSMTGAGPPLRGDRASRWLARARTMNGVPPPHPEPSPTRARRPIGITSPADVAANGTQISESLGYPGQVLRRQQSSQRVSSAAPGACRAPPDHQRTGRATSE